MKADLERILAQRLDAAERYRPVDVKLLLVAEAPPADGERYFYFLTVKNQDSLFRYVCKGLLGVTPNRENKGSMLDILRRQGVFLVDLKLDPVDGSPLALSVPGLIARCQSISPERIILIKASVYDAAFDAMKAAGLPVINCRIPFPGSGQQVRFEREFNKALSIAEWQRST